MYVNLILWCVRLTIVAKETEQRLLCGLFGVTVTIKIMSVAQQCFHGEFMSQATTERSCKVLDIFVRF